MGPELIFVVLNMTKDCQLERLQGRHGDSAGTLLYSHLSLLKIKTDRYFQGSFQMVYSVFQSNFLVSIGNTIAILILQEMF